MAGFAESRADRAIVLEQMSHLAEVQQCLRTQTARKRRDSYVAKILQPLILANRHGQRLAAANSERARQSTLFDLMHDPSVGSSVVGIAAAAGDFQSFAVHDGYLAAVVFDQSAFLQGTGRLGDANPAHAKHKA